MKQVACIATCNPPRAPENTIAAGLAAVSPGGDIIELDARQSRDGMLYMLHDATLDRIRRRAMSRLSAGLLPQASTVPISPMPSGGSRRKPEDRKNRNLAGMAIRREILRPGNGGFLNA